jgi:hypothetical protein
VQFIIGFFLSGSFCLGGFCPRIHNLQLPMQSVPITTDVVSSNPDQGEVYNIMWKVWLATGQWFSSGPPVSSTNKTDCHDIIEILLKVALNTIKPNLYNSIATDIDSFNYNANFYRRTPVFQRFNLYITE